MQIKQNDTYLDEAPLVSFIIPVYDLPVQLLQACIDSIRALSLRVREREIILIDDGSPHPATPLLAEYGDEVIYVHKPNGGVSTARNMGLRMATGKYVQFVDGDDKLLRTGYEHVLDMMRYENVDVVMFDFSTTECAEMNYDDEPATTGRELLRNSNIRGATWSYLFRRLAAGELMFTPGIAYGEDEEFTPQLLLRADCVIRTTAKAYYYRPRMLSAIHDHSMRKRLQRLNDAQTVIKRLFLLADTMPAGEHAALLRRVHQLAMDYIYNIILLTQNRHYLDRKLNELRKMNLYPLPKRDYTKKYTWFRRLSSTSLGISMLMRTIPLMHKER
jgi:glycosyltransferase involved in cell wall biosynthesis